MVHDNTRTPQPVHGAAHLKPADTASAPTPHPTGATAARLHSLTAHHDRRHSGARRVAPMTPLLLQVDGTPGFPPRGVAGLGIVVRSAQGHVLQTRALRAPAATCNEAEYQALIAGLTFLHQRYPAHPLRCHSDSRVVVDQLLGRCAVRTGPLQPLYAEALVLMGLFPTIELLAIPRELNRLADALAWEALGGRVSLMRFKPS